MVLRANLMSNPPDEDDAVEAQLALSYEVDLDPVDVSEDRLTERLGYRRHPAMLYRKWWKVRAIVAGADPQADEIAARV